MMWNSELKPRARRLRRTSTEAETCLWSRLRNRALGVKFRRQVPLDRYILDFYCAEARLVVEVDGVQHLEPEGLDADARRTRALEELGLTVIRFLDNEVLLETDGVVQAIVDQLEQGVAEGR